MLCSLDSGQIPREITFIYLYALNLFHHSSVQNDTNSSYMRTHEREHDLNNNRDLSQRETSHTDVTYLKVGTLAPVAGHPYLPRGPPSGSSSVVKRRTPGAGIYCDCEAGVRW